jgi:purine-binding chemotaxis protein CheW
MENKQYLTFRLHDVQYGIEAALVQEILPIPQITPIADAPTDVLGIINLRGEIVPLLQLNLSQEQKLSAYSENDYFLVTKWQEFLIGILVNQVNEVIELNHKLIETYTEDDIRENLTPEFIAGIAQINSNIIFLLNPDTLVRQPDALVTLIWDVQTQMDDIPEVQVNDKHDGEPKNEQQEEEEIYDSSLNEFELINTDSEEKASFRQIADNFREFVEVPEEPAKLVSLAVISWSNQYFGINLELVREFADIRNLAPIPCCPKHILGNMNLRGEVITLVDIRQSLNLPITPLGIGSQVLVIQVEDIIAGLPVDEVFQVVYLKDDEIVPSTTFLTDDNQQYLSGTALLEGKIMSILDLAKIFTQGSLAVYEEV